MDEPQEESLGLGINGSRVAEALAGSVLPLLATVRELWFSSGSESFSTSQKELIYPHISRFDLSKPLSLSETISSPEKECMCVWCVYGVGVEGIQNLHVYPGPWIKIQVSRDLLTSHPEPGMKLTLNIC